jgi:hypothetical protein
MLRYGFLPSDYHPMLLFLGEAADLRAFAGLMRDFAQAPRDVRFETTAFMHATDKTRVLLTGSGAQAGMRALDLAARSFVWTLEPWQADMFSGEVADLARPGRRSGSAMLEAALGEVPVKVSLGEYTDDFLTEKRPG